MEIPFTNFPKLFETLGDFLYKLEELRENRHNTNKFFEIFDALFAEGNQDGYDGALAAYNKIVDALYFNRRARECLGGSPRLR